MLALCNRRQLWVNRVGFGCAGGMSVLTPIATEIAICVHVG
jgi:hypothetical protein